MAGNKVADGAAVAARHAAAAGGARQLRYPAGGTRFFYTWHGGAVVEDPSTFVRQVGQKQALQAWSRRPIQGAVARELLAGTARKLGYPVRRLAVHSPGVAGATGAGGAQSSGSSGMREVHFKATVRVPFQELNRMVLLPFVLTATI